MKSANYSPVYCALYPQLAEITRKHGYALAVHGSMARDFDLICIPWIDSPGEPSEVVREIEATFQTRNVGGPPDTKAHGREVWTLSIGFGECFLDLSFMPKTKIAEMTDGEKDYITELAEIRDMFPGPAVGEYGAREWESAMSLPECVPHYVKTMLNKPATDLKKENCWECNECGAQEYTLSVSENDVHKFACGSCGGDEFHKAYQAPPKQKVDL